MFKLILDKPAFRLRFLPEEMSHGLTAAAMRDRLLDAPFSSKDGCLWLKINSVDDLQIHEPIDAETGFDLSRKYRDIDPNLARFGVMLDSGPTSYDNFPSYEMVIDHHFPFGEIDLSLEDPMLGAMHSTIYAKCAETVRRCLGQGVPRAVVNEIALNRVVQNRDQAAIDELFPKEDCSNVEFVAVNAFQNETGEMARSDGGKFLPNNGIRGEEVLDNCLVRLRWDDVAARLLSIFGITN